MKDSEAELLSLRVSDSELDEIHDGFLRALSTDSSPPSSVALFWHEAVSVKRDPKAPDAITQHSSSTSWDLRWCVTFRARTSRTRSSRFTSARL